ncbi:hypothetical protein [Lysobacter capsici]|nr:hypothetical protein [Lysobacter capsici]
MVEPIGGSTRNADKQGKNLTEIVWIKRAETYGREVDASMIAGT